MFCVQCGRELPKNTNKCPYCQLQSEPQPNPTAQAHRPDSSQAQNNIGVYKFSKDKGISSATYKSVSTVATIHQEALELESTTTWFAFFEKPTKRTIIQLDQIVGIQSKFTWDFWDTAFAILALFVFCLTFQWWPLLVFIVCLLCAMGHGIELSLKNGVKHRILYDSIRGKGDFIEELRKAVFYQFQSEEQRQEYQSPSINSYSGFVYGSKRSTNTEETSGPEYPRIEKRFCPACGKEATGYRFCSYCGTPIR